MNFYFASLALGSAGLGTHSKIAFYEMPAGSNTFKLVSVPVDVGSGELENLTRSCPKSLPARRPSPPPAWHRGV